MSNSDTPIGDNGKNYTQVKINNHSDKEFEKKWKNFFEDDKANVNAVCVYANAEREIEEEKAESNKKITSALNVLSSVRYKFEMDRIVECVKAAVKSGYRNQNKMAMGRKVDNKTERMANNEDTIR